MNLSARLKSMRTAKSSKRRLDIFKIKKSPEIQKRPVVVSQIFKENDTDPTTSIYIEY